jgi:predicted phosphodiesterase
MKFGIISDLHMGRTLHTEETDWDFEPKHDVFYICAGDICEDPEARSAFVRKHADHMFAINGNHDYYGDTFIHAKYHLMLREVNGLKIAGASLWTDLSFLQNWYIYTKRLIDKKFIKDLNYPAMMETHETHLNFLLKSEADIIVSHHCPSRMSVHPKYAGDIVNCCFMTDLTEQILAMKKPPKLWIHGHTHDDFDYMIGDTRVICHPRGYKNERDDYWRYAPKIVEI